MSKGQSISDSYDHQSDNQTKPELFNSISFGPLPLADYRRIKKGAEFRSFDEFKLHFSAWKDHFHHPFRIYNSDKFRLPNGEVHPLFKVRAVSYHCSRYGEPRPRGSQANLGGKPTKHLACGCRAGLRIVYSATGDCLRITTFNDKHNGHQTSGLEYHAIVNKQYKRLFTQESRTRWAKSHSTTTSSTSQDPPPKSSESPSSQPLIPTRELSLFPSNPYQLHYLMFSKYLNSIIFKNDLLLKMIEGKVMNNIPKTTV